MLFKSLQGELDSLDMPPSFPVRIVVTSGADMRAEFALRMIEQQLIDSSEFDAPDGYTEVTLNRR